MAITAIALLRIPSCSPNPEPIVRVETLEDALLLRTEMSFGSDPEALGELLRQSLGAQLDQHRDARGVFVLPSVARPAARSYEALIAEIGEGGMWVPMPARASAPFALPGGLGGLPSVLGDMMQHMPASLLDAASAASAGDMQNLAQVGAQVSQLLGQTPSGGLLGQTPSGGVDMQRLAELVAASGIDFSSPVFQQMLASLQQALARDPQKLQQLAEQLFGQIPPDDQGK